MMNSSQVRVVDPVLSNHALGYRHPERIGSLLFPRVEVTVGGGKRIEFGKESFLLYNARREPGAQTMQISFGYEGAPFTLVQDALDSLIPREHMRDASAVPGIDLGMRAVSVVMNTLTLGLEVEQAEIATNPAGYDDAHKTTLAAGAKWSTADGDPLADIETGKQAVRGTTGMRPNVLILSPDAWKAAKNNKKVKAELGLQGGPLTLDRFKELVEIENVAVGEAVYADATVDGAFHDVWRNVAVLAYAAQKPSGNEEPSFGYTYTMRGHPAVETPYFSNERKSWVYGVVYERVPVLTGMAAGYLIQSPA